MAEVSTLDSDRLSTFRTNHHFRHYGEFTTAAEYAEYRAWARDKGLPLFILGNGSNTLFTRHNVRSLVLRNRIPEEIRPLGGDLFHVSSSTQVMRVVWCAVALRASCRPLHVYSGSLEPCGR